MQYLTPTEVRAEFRISKTTLARWVKERNFPAPVRLGPSSPRFDAEAVQRWVDQRSVKGDAR